MGWPSCRYGPGDQSAIFECEEDVPAGWADHPSKVGAFNGADPAKFDHDGDGQPGGSKPRRTRKLDQRAPDAFDDGESYRTATDRVELP